MAIDDGLLRMVIGNLVTCLVGDVRRALPVRAESRDPLDPGRSIPEV